MPQLSEPFDRGARPGPWWPGAPLSRHPLLGDLLLAVAVLLVSAPGDPQNPGLTVPAALNLLLMTIPLVWRRRYPLAVFAVVMAVASAQWALAPPDSAPVALAVALYSVAAHEPHRRTWVAAGVVEVGIVLCVLRWAPPGRELLFAILATTTAAAPLVAGLLARTRRAYWSALEERAKRLERERDQQGRLAAASERARIAGELHDVVAHHVSVMVTLADGARLAAHADPANASVAMAQVSSTGRQALTEMRRLLGVLHEPGSSGVLTPQPDLDDLPALLDGVRGTGLRVELLRSGTSVALPAAVSLMVYRIVQESLTNTLKHAHRATTARVGLRFGAGILEVQVDDDGRVAAPVGAGRGYGLTGMSERAALVGGRLQTGPGPDGGWRVLLSVELPATGDLPASGDLVDPDARNAAP